MADDAIRALRSWHHSYIARFRPVPRAGRLQLPQMKEGTKDAENLSAQEAPAQPRPRLPQEDVHQQRPQGPGPPPRQRPQDPFPVKGRPLSPRWDEKRNGSASSPSRGGPQRAGQSVSVDLYDLSAPESRGRAEGHRQSGKFQASAGQTAGPFSEGFRRFDEASAKWPLWRHFCCGEVCRGPWGPRAGGAGGEKEGFS